MQGLLLADSPSDPSSPPWAMIVIGLLTLIYVAFVRPLKKKRERDPLAKMPGNTQLSQQRAIERDMTALLIEYEQMMRTMTGQLDTRSAKLQTLLQDADEKLAALRVLIDRANALPATVPAQHALISSAKALAGEMAIASSAPVPASASGSGQVPAKPSVSESACFESNPGELRARERNEAKTPAADPHAEIYSLADRGLSYRQIARQLGQADGEIELILALRPFPSEEDPRIADGALSAAASRRQATDTRPTTSGRPRRKHAI